MDDRMKRKLSLRQLTNDQLFSQYDSSELVFKNPSPRSLSEARRILGHFQSFLGQYPPSPELAKGFLSQYLKHRASTLSRYATCVRGFMTWLSEDLDLKVKVPKTLPEYVSEDDIANLRRGAREKKTHKRLAKRDEMLIDLAAGSGLRRSELANLTVGDLVLDKKMLLVRDAAKGGKHRTVPLPIDVVRKLAAYVQGKPSEASVFGIRSKRISALILSASRRAGVNLHTHSLRQHYATRLLEKGANIRSVQTLLGHESVATTEIYTALSPTALFDAVHLLEDDEEPAASEVPSTLHPLDSSQIARPLGEIEAAKTEQVASELFAEAFKRQEAGEAIVHIKNGEAEISLMSGDWEESETNTPPVAS